MQTKIVNVNGIVVEADLNGKTAFDAVIAAATINRIHSFDVEVDGSVVDEKEIKEIGSNWNEISIKTSEKPAYEDENEDEPDNGNEDELDNGNEDEPDNGNEGESKHTFRTKIVTVNGIIVQADVDGLEAYAAVIKAATLNRIHSFDVEVNGSIVDESEIKEIGKNWSEINIKTSEKPAWTA